MSGEYEILQTDFFPSRCHMARSRWLLTKIGTRPNRRNHKQAFWSTRVSRHYQSVIAKDHPISGWAIIWERLENTTGFSVEERTSPGLRPGIQRSMSIRWFLFFGGASRIFSSM